MYIDPDGEIAWFIPIIIGALIGGYTGGVIANDGQLNPIKWNYSSGRTWGYMLGGAVVGGGSAWLGGCVAAAGGFMSNTMAIGVGSFTNSIGMHIVTNGKTPVSVSFGVVSYNFRTNEWNSFSDKNSALENIGYGFGALTNISDLVTAYDRTQALKRKDQTSGLSNEELRELWRKSRDTKLNEWGSLNEPKVAHYAGTSPSVNPEELLKAGIKLIGVDGSETGGIFGGYQHDLAYWYSGTDGARGALFNFDVLQADKNLAFGMRQMMSAGLTGNTLTAARNVNVLFSVIAGYKMFVQYQYLYHLNLMNY